MPALLRILDAKYRLPEVSYLMTSRTFLAFGYGKMLNYYQIWLPALDFQEPFLPTNSTSEVTSILESRVKRFAAENYLLLTYSCHY